MTFLRRILPLCIPALLIVVGCCFMPACPVYGQLPSLDLPEYQAPLPAMLDTDTNDVQAPVPQAVTDSLQGKSEGFTSKKASSQLSEIVEYQAKDSLVFLAGGVGVLYGSGQVKYVSNQLKAGYIRMNMDSSLLYAEGVRDTNGILQEKPIFTDKSESFESTSLQYNFTTGKGLIKDAVTQQGEGYVVSGLTKKTNDDIMCMIDGKYTTCDNHEHPHFYLALSKAKVKPGTYLVSGPAHLVMEDVHLPIFIPFGYFPMTPTYSSGILTPTYGDELSRGFYLKDMGYYFAFNDYVDMSLTGDLYSKGSWGIRARSSYRMRYKFSGSFNVSYLETVTSEKNLPDYQKSKDLNVTWGHSQDPKADPFRTFSASVNFSTSGYTRNDLASYYNPQAFSNNTKSSSINLTQRFPESPFTASMNMSITQRTKDSVLSITLPSFRISMSTISPFKRKNAVGSERWYERIRVGYSASFANSINEVKEYDLLKKSIIKDWRNGVQHSIPISATFSVLNYINITPSINYTERWASSSLEKYFDNELNKEVTDTVWGFNRIWDYSTSVSASSKLYGYFQPVPFVNKLLGERLKMIRHVLTPSVSFTYRPDFGDEKYGYYGSYSTLDEDSVLRVTRYSRFANSLYGTPGTGKSGSVGFSVSNNLEMKLRQWVDSTETEKKVSLIDNFSFSGNYNLAADSMNWSNIGVNLRIKFGKLYTLNLSTSLDPYMYQLNSKGNPVRVNVTTWEKLRIPGRFTGAGTSFSYSISNDTFKKKDKKEGSGENGDGDEASGVQDEGAQVAATPYEPVDPEDDLYKKLASPWSINLSYSLRYGQSKFNVKKMYYDYKLTQSLSLSGSLSLFSTWKLSANTSYDFVNKEFAMLHCNISRDLHCWEMSASFIPIGRFKSYNFSVRVKSGMLSDLKYEQQQNNRDNYIWGR